MKKEKPKKFFRRPCMECGKPMIKSKETSQREFDKRKFCNNKCKRKK